MFCKGLRRQLTFEQPHREKLLSHVEVMKLEPETYLLHTFGAKNLYISERALYIYYYILYYFTDLCVCDKHYWGVNSGPGLNSVIAKLFFSF